MTRLGLPELTVIVVLALLLFGPQLVRRFGQSIKEMRQLAKGNENGQE